MEIFVASKFHGRVESKNQARIALRGLSGQTAEARDCDEQITWVYDAETDSLRDRAS